jgi:hypothetical protein
MDDPEVIADGSTRNAGVIDSHSGSIFALYFKHAPLRRAVGASDFAFWWLWSAKGECET